MAFPQDNGLFILDTDASDYGIGSVLSQIQYSEVIERMLKDQFILLASL